MRYRSRCRRSAPAPLRGSLCLRHPAAPPSSLSCRSGRSCAPRASIGKGEQRRRPGEEQTTEVHAQPVAHDRHPQVIHRTGQLPDLIRAEELRLVDEDAGARAFSQTLFDLRQKVFVRLESVGLVPDPDTRCDPPVSGAVVEFRGHQIGDHAAFDIVMSRLQKYGRFARVHGRIMKVKLCHGPL